MNFEGKAREAHAALDAAERELAEVQRLGVKAREAKEAAEAAYDASPTPTNAERALDARREAELVQIRDERTRRRVETARAEAEAARAELDGARRKALLEDLISRGDVTAFRAASAEDLATVDRLVGELVAVMERIEVRARAVTIAAAEAKRMGADVPVPTNRLGEGLVVFHRMRGLPEGDWTAQRWHVEGAWLFYFFFAAREKAGLVRQLRFGDSTGPVPHDEAFKNIFPELYAKRGVPGAAALSSAMSAARRIETEPGPPGPKFPRLVDAAARLAAGEALASIFGEEPSPGAEHPREPGSARAPQLGELAAGGAS
jgi:hypothetical protein